MTASSVAVIGSGISGLSAAWLLSKSRQVTLFEKAPTLGGHTNTIVAPTPDGPVAVDTGFIVYNEKNYPNLTAMFAHLGVSTAPSYMSFAVSIDGGRMEYSGEHLNGLFGQRRNIVRPEHWQLVADILRFFRQAEQQVALCPIGMSIGDFLDHHKYSRAFVEDHILPMSAAIWSTPSRGMLAFPAHTFISFFSNHALLQLADRPKWRTVHGGGAVYVSSLLANSPISVSLNAEIAKVRRHAQGVEIYFANGSHKHFDEVIFACHADQALALLADPSEAEHRVLSAFRYTKNRAILHTNQSFMPKRRHLWASWNYLRGPGADGALSLSYWMNRLQPLPTRTNLFVTLNPNREIPEKSVLYEVDYDHPLFDSKAIDTQRDVWQIQGVNKTWFAGAWMGCGFHEDGLQSGLEIAERIAPNHRRPWTISNQRHRIAHNWAEGEQPLWAAE
jgi:predicted NAD/FAD-binding protein